MRGRIRLGYDVRELTIGRVLADKAARNGDRIYLHFVPDGRTFSYRDMEVRSNRVANGLLAAGIERGQHVAVMMSNRPEQLWIYHALGKIGAVAVPLNVEAKADQLKYFINQSDSTALVADEASLSLFAEVRGDCPRLRHAWGLPQGRCLPRAALESGIAEYGSLEAYGDTAPAVQVRFNDLAYIMYTSGTTGPSKGVMVTHAGSLLWAISAIEAYGYRLTDTLYTCLPLFHVNALLGSSNTALLTDAKLALSGRFSASRFWDEVRGSRATVINLLGSMLNILWNAPPSPLDRQNDVRYARAAPIPKFALEFEERFGLRLIGGFGLSDYGAGMALPTSDPVSKLGSAGRAKQGWRVRIVDEDDFEVPTGEVGEIAMRCECIWETSLGYYKMPEATLAAHRNGWFHTGDRAYMDEDGYVWFADRQKDAIRRRGENISTWEVEQGILKHPAVSDVAVFPVRADMAEDEVAAAIVLCPGQAMTEADLIEHCRTQMARFMVPRYVWFLADLPRTATQKIEKHRLRSTAENDLSVLWDRESVSSEKRPAAKPR
jgi:crotonobetaine/carnitine-CoA ligase